MFRLCRALTRSLLPERLLWQAAIQVLPRLRGREGWGPGGARLVLMALLLCFAFVPAQAADPNPVAAQSPPVAADEIERLVHTLQDDAARAKLVEQLRALIAAQHSAEKEKPPAAALFGALSQQVDALSGEILAGSAMLVDSPRLLGWAREQVSDAAARRLWAEAAFAFALTFGGAILAELALRGALSRLLPRLPIRRSDTRLVRGFFALLGLMLAALPIAIFAAVAYAILSIAAEPYTRTRITLTVLTNATVQARLLLCKVPALASAQPHHQPVIEPTTFALHELQNSGVLIAQVQADLLGFEHRRPCD